MTRVNIDYAINQLAKGNIIFDTIEIGSKIYKVKGYHKNHKKKIDKSLVDVEWTNCSKYGLENSGQVYPMDIEKTFKNSTIVDGTSFLLFKQK